MYIICFQLRNLTLQFDDTQETNDCSSYLRLYNTNLLEVANTVSLSRNIELQGHVTFLSYYNRTQITQKL